MVARLPKRAARQAQRFSSTDHLSAEAVSALVDGELSPAAERRAHAHVDQCPECLADVICQQRAADRLRRCSSDDGVHAPSALVQKLACLDDGGLSGVRAEDARRAPAAARAVESAFRTLRRRG